MKESAQHLAFFVAAAVAFGFGVWMFAGGQFAAEYFAGWLTEYSLSVDNLFIFLIIMSKFAVPRHLQQSALLVGIILALIFRGIFIGVGAAAINTSSWSFYLFAGFLIYTAVKLAREGQSEDDEFDENALIRWTRNHLPATDQYHGAHLTVRQNGRRLITPMLVVLISLGTTDLLFALDSIPAIYGLTKEPYLVLMANIFALMGLRQLYFLIGGLLQRLVYLSLGLAFLLFFIGVKLVLHALHTNELPFVNGGEHVAWAPEIPIWLSLLVILGTLTVATVATVASLRATRRERASGSGGASATSPSETGVRDAVGR